MPIPNRTLIEKADLALSELTTGGGDLVPAQAQQFIKLLVEQSTFMRQCTVVPMKAQKQRVSKIGITGRVLKPGSPSTALDNPADRQRPVFSYVELDAQLFRGEVRIPDEVIEDNIEGPKLQNAIMDLTTESIARDMEEVVLQGDTDSADVFLATFDGVIKLMTSHTVDCAGADVSFAKLSEIQRSLPRPYQRLREKYRFFTSPIAEDDYRALLEARETQAGDDNITEFIPARYHGTPIVPVGMMPATLGDESDETVALYLDPKNVHVGIWRSIRIELDRDKRAGFVSILPTVRFDVKIAVEDACVKAIDLKND